MYTLKLVTFWSAFKEHPVLHIQSSPYVNGHVTLYAYGLANSKTIDDGLSCSTRTKYNIKLWRNIVPNSLKEWSELIDSKYNALVRGFLCKFVIYDCFFLFYALESGLDIYTLSLEHKENLIAWTRRSDETYCNFKEMDAACTALEFIPQETSNTKLIIKQSILVVTGYEHGDIELFTLCVTDKTFALVDKAQSNKRSLPVLCLSYRNNFLGSKYGLFIAVGGLSKRVAIFFISQHIDIPKLDFHSYIDTQTGAHAMCWTNFGLFVCQLDGSICCYEYSLSSWTSKCNLASSTLMHCPAIFCVCLSPSFKHDSDSLPISPLHCIMNGSKLLVVVGQNGLVTLWNPDI